MVASLSATAMAKPVRKPISYSLNEVAYESVLVFDDAGKAGRPGVLLVPNWLGINEANLKQAERVAGKDTVVSVVDMYGKAARPKSQEEAGKAAGALKADRPQMRARAARALEIFHAQASAAKVNVANTGAVGFCFGGTTVMELAKSGADLKAAVSIHGGLDAVIPTQAKPKAKILALHGAADPTVPRESLQAFQDDLAKVQADWTLVQFGGAVHSFTDVDANTPGRSMYDPRAAARAYEMMRQYFAESFKGTAGTH